MIKISVVVPVYNSERFLGDCLKSVESQTYPNVQLVLVNDASTDSSLSVIEEYASTHPGTIVINNSRNMGAGYSRRAGIENSTGDYVITLDSDDYFSVDFLADLARKQEETQADIVSGGITILKAGGGFRAETRGSHISEGMDKFNDYANKQIVFLNNKIVRRSMYNEVPYSTRRYVEDTPVVVPLLYNANKVANVDNAGYFYRQREDSICHTVTRFQDHLFKALCAKDLVEYLKDKPKEYHGLCDVNEYTLHLKGMKENPPTAEEQRTYAPEIAECLTWLLYNVMTFS